MSLPQPLVSVIIPTFNRMAYLPTAIESVVDQTYEAWELILVDDGSTDGTREYASRLEDPRVKTVWLEHTGNPSVVRNIGICQARGKYVAFLDSDDVWHATKLALQVAAMAADPACRWSYTNFATIDAEGREIDRPAGGPWVPYSGWILEDLLSYRAAVVTPTVIVETALFHAIGGFDERWLFTADYDLWLRLASRAPIRVVDAVLASARHHGGRRTKGRIDVHEWKVAIFGALHASTDDRKVRRACRRRSAEHLLKLARHHSANGRHWTAFRTLGRAWRFEPLESRWWTGLATACARVMLPAAVLALYRKAKRRATRPEPTR
jgi:glycosyltransferase involved in cell wall biosynthesis